MGLSAGTAFVDIQPNIGAGFQGAIASKLGPAGVAAGAVLAVGVAAGVGGAIALKNIGDQFDDALDTIRVGTGATGAELEALGTSFKNALVAVPADSQQAAEAISLLNQRTGASGPILETLAAQQLELARITGTELGPNIESTTRLLGDWGVGLEDAEGAIDAVFRASQATGVPVNQLAESVVKFGAPLRQFGFGLDESAALLGQFEQSGVNTNLAMGSLRIALGKFSKAGRDPVEALGETMDAIKNAGSVAEGNAIAFEVFGARAGADMGAAIREGKFELTDLLDELGGSSDTIRGAAADTEDYGEKWTKLKNKVLVALEPLATKFLEALGKLFDFIGEKAGPIIDAFSSALSGVGGLFGGIAGEGEGLAAKLSPLLEALGTAFSTAFGIIKDVIGGVIAFIKDNQETFRSIFDTIIEIVGQVADYIKVVFTGIKEFWDKWGDTIIGVLSNIWGVIAGVIDGALKVIKGIIDVLLGIMSGDWSRVWTGIKSIFSGIWTAIVGIFKGFVGNILTIAKGFLANFGTSIKNGLSNVITFFRELPGKVLNALKSLPGAMVRFGASLITGLIRGLGNIVGSVYKKLKDGIAGAINKVKSFFGIGSPSKVVALELGLPLAQGVALGAEATAKLTGESLTAGIEEAVASARQGADLAAVVRGTDLGISGPNPAAAAELAGAGGGTSIIVEEGGIVVHYPEKELASIAIPRELRRTATSLNRG